MSTSESRATSATAAWWDLHCVSKRTRTLDTAAASSFSSSSSLTCLTLVSCYLYDCLRYLVLILVLSVMAWLSTLSELSDWACVTIYHSPIIPSVIPAKIRKRYTFIPFSFLYVILFRGLTLTLLTPAACDVLIVFGLPVIWCAPCTFVHRVMSPSKRTQLTALDTDADDCPSNFAVRVSKTISGTSIVATSRNVLWIANAIMLALLSRLIRWMGYLAVCYKSHKHTHRSIPAVASEYGLVGQTTKDTIRDSCPRKTCITWNDLTLHTQMLKSYSLALSDSTRV